ncbi:MAG: hypothetical protein PHS66_02405 [Candidatus Omnitrophica bacterium]|nr:hypothetical protein [Candidatus Omnitrophota bacterium]
MNNYFERIVKVVYREWKTANRVIEKDHPDAELLACFLEGNLPAQEKEIIQKHIVRCGLCSEYLSAQLRIQPHLSLDVPDPLLEKVGKLVKAAGRENLLEVFLQLRDKALGIIQTSGDVLFGQELIPASLLRSRKINEFKEEVSILKDLQRIRVMIKVQSKSAQSFNLIIAVKDKQGRVLNKELRVTLLKEGVELESYVMDSESSSFENIPPGDYQLEISRKGENEAVIDLRVKA